MAFQESKSKADLLLEKEEILADPTKSLEEKRAAHLEIMQSVMNPVPEQEFNPTTFEPFGGDPDIEIRRRPRKSPPDRLPTLGILPKELLEGQLVGMYESKQDLYLLMAHYINQLLDRVDELEKQVGR